MTEQERLQSALPNSVAVILPKHSWLVGWPRIIGLQKKELTKYLVSAVNIRRPGQVVKLTKS